MSQCAFSPSFGTHQVNLNDFEALSFDCYDTLIDWETGIATVLRRWADAYGLGMTDQELLSIYSSDEASAEAEHPTDSYPKILARSMRDLGAEVGVAVSDTEASSLATSVSDWPAFPDSAGALGRLARRYKLIILSNVDRQSFAASNRRLGVTFTSIITAEDVGSYKPSPRNFEALETEIARLGVAKDKLLHVAQSLFHDHVPACTPASTRYGSTVDMPRRAGVRRQPRAPLLRLSGPSSRWGHSLTRSTLKLPDRSAVHAAMVLLPEAIPRDRVVRCPIAE